MTSFLLNVGRSQKIMWFREKDYSSITFQTCSLWWGGGHWEFWQRKCLDPQGTEGIHSVSAPEGHASGLLGAGMSKPPKIHLPKVEPFLKVSDGFALFLPPPCLFHCSPTSCSWFTVRGLSWRCLHWVLSQGCGKQETGSKRDGCQLAPARSIGVVGQVEPPRASCLSPAEPCCYFLCGEEIMCSRHMWLNLLLTTRIITYPTVASQLVDISNISSLLKSEGGNAVSFLKEETGALFGVGWGWGAGCSVEGTTAQAVIPRLKLLGFFPCSRELM